MAKPEEMKKSEEPKMAPPMSAFDDEEPAPAPKPAKSAVHKVVARMLRKDDDYRVGFNPARSPGHIDPTDPEGKRFLPARVGAFVNSHGVVFPDGYSFKGAHVAFDGRVYLVKCPRCGHRNNSDRAASGICGNMKANEGNGCGYSAIEVLEEITKP